jgi:hypothetical protein
MDEGDVVKPSSPEVIHFPSEDKSRGTSLLHGAVHHMPLRGHISTPFGYLSESAASPLQLAFVENDDPLCAYVGPARDVFTEGYHQVWFFECDVERMEEVVPLFYKVIEKQCEGDASFDVGRMKKM